MATAAAALNYDVVLERFLAILLFPQQHPDLIPSLLPVVVGMFVLEFYFGRYKQEELGWNTAVGNATMLVTTALTLIYQLKLHLRPTTGEALVAFSIFLVGGIVLTLNFYHLWPKMIAFNISSAFTVYALVYLTMALTYSSIPIDTDTLAAATLFFFALAMFFKTIKSMQDTVY